MLFDEDTDFMDELERWAIEASNERERKAELKAEAERGQIYRRNRENEADAKAKWHAAWDEWNNEAETVVQGLRRQIVATSRSSVPHGGKLQLRGYVSNAVSTTNEMVAWVDVFRQVLDFAGTALVDLKISHARGGYVHISGNVLSPTAKGDRSAMITSIADTLQRLLYEVPSESFSWKDPPLPPDLQPETVMFGSF